jgi:hypothetical protein
MSEDLVKDVTLTGDEFFILNRAFEGTYGSFKSEDQRFDEVKSLAQKGLVYWRRGLRRCSVVEYFIHPEYVFLVGRVASLVRKWLSGKQLKELHSIKFSHKDGVLESLSVSYPWDGSTTFHIDTSEPSSTDHANTHDTSCRDELICDVCGGNPISEKKEDGVIKESVVEVLPYELESPTQVSDNHYRKMNIQATDIAEQIMENNVDVPVKSRYLVCMGIKHLIRLGLKKDNDWEKELKKAINYFVRALTGKWVWQVDLNELFERVK